MSNDNIFRAKAIQIGSCGSPTCCNVHINLCDADGEVRAVALIHRDELWPVLLELTTIATEMAGRDLLSLEPGETAH